MFRASSVFVKTNSQGCGEKAGFASGFSSLCTQCFLISQASGISTAVPAQTNKHHLEETNAVCHTLPSASYLTVRLVMQYFHMAPPTASDISKKTLFETKKVSAPSRVSAANYRLYFPRTNSCFFFFFLLVLELCLPELPFSCCLDQVR